MILKDASLSPDKIKFSKDFFFYFIKGYVFKDASLNPDDISLKDTILLILRIFFKDRFFLIRVKSIKKLLVCFVRV